MKSEPVATSAIADELWTRAQAAEFLRLDPRSLGLWSRRGWLVPLKLPSGQTRYRKSDVLAVVETAKVAP
jgi:hypothetical protein